MTRPDDAAPNPVQSVFVWVLDPVAVERATGFWAPVCLGGFAAVGLSEAELPATRRSHSSVASGQRLDVHRHISRAPL